MTKKKKEYATDVLLSERSSMIKELNSVNLNQDRRKQIEDRIEHIEAEIGDEITEKFKGEIDNTVKKMGSVGHELNGNGRNMLWKILKKNFPKNLQSVPVAKKDNRRNLITNHVSLKKLYQKTYKSRLRNRPMAETS